MTVCEACPPKAALETPWLRFGCGGKGRSEEGVEVGEIFQTERSGTREGEGVGHKSREHDKPYESSSGHMC